MSHVVDSELKKLSYIFMSVAEYASWHYRVFKNQPENIKLYNAPGEKMRTIYESITKLTKGWY